MNSHLLPNDLMNSEGSKQAARRDRTRGQVLLTCDCGCGEEFYRDAHRVEPGRLKFISVQHAGAYKTRTYLAEMCGPHLGLVTEYLNGFANDYYKSLPSIRKALAPFFLYLTECDGLEVDHVTPKQITRFLGWAEEVEHKSAAHDISVLSTFFSWAIREGHYKGANPVVPRFHGQRRKHYLPRPYSADEMKFIWELAYERGNCQIRAALSIGEEAGLRLSEICRLRLEDVDVKGRRLFVRLPNKTDQERWALFSDKTVRHLSEWLTQRKSDCSQPDLFQNRHGKPLSSASLHDEFRRTFCKTYDGRSLHEVGLDCWSTHRLRHTMASNLVAGGATIPTVMMAGGWKQVSTMLIYAQNDTGAARRGYDEAMRRRDEVARAPESRRVISPESLLAKLSGGMKS